MQTLRHTNILSTSVNYPMASYACAVESGLFWSESINDSKQINRQPGKT